MNVPDGTSQGIQMTMAYSIVTPSTPNDNLGDGLTWFLTEVKDGIANKVPAPPANTGRRLTYDACGNRLAVREYDQIGTSTSLTALTTKYVYDPLDQLVSVIDAKGNLTSKGYDTVGRMVTLTNPDAGLTEYRFDLNGNLKEKQSASCGLTTKQSSTVTILTASSRSTIRRRRMSDTRTGCRRMPGNNAGNLAGRIKSVTFDNGSELRFYDHMGNVRETRTTLNRMSTTTGLPASMTFNMKYTYDWLGRMQTMTFPNWINQSFSSSRARREGDLFL